MSEPQQIDLIASIKKISVKGEHPDWCNSVSVFEYGLLDKEQKEIYFKYLENVIYEQPY